MTDKKNSILTLIYFLNHSQPRTVRIPVWKLKTALAIAVVAVFWVPVTAWVIPSLIMTNSSIEDELQEQQIMFAHEYKKNQKLLDTITRSVGQIEDTSIAQTTTTQNKIKSTLRAKTPTQKIGIDGFNASSQHNQLDISFVQLNRDKNRISEGTYWAVAEFKTADGSSLFISYPQGVVDETGATVNPELGKKFALRNQKQRQLSLHVPKSVEGNFKKIQIGFQPASGTSKSFSFSLDRLSMK